MLEHVWEALTLELCADWANAWKMMQQDLDPNELGEGEAWDADEAWGRTGREEAAEDEGCEMHVLYAVIGGDGASSTTVLHRRTGVLHIHNEETKPIAI